MVALQHYLIRRHAYPNRQAVWKCPSPFVRPDFSSPAYADQLDYTVFEDNRAVRAHAMRQQRAGTSHQHFQSRVLEYLEKKSWTGTFGVA